MDFNREFTAKKETRKIEYNTRRKKGPLTAPKKKKPPKKKKEDVKEEVYIVSDNFIFSNVTIDMLVETVEKIDFYTEKIKNEVKSVAIDTKEKQEEFDKIIENPLIDLTVYEKVVKARDIKGLGLGEIINAYRGTDDGLGDTLSPNNDLSSNEERSSRSRKRGAPKPTVPVHKPTFARVYNNSVIKPLNIREIDADLNLIFDKRQSRLGADGTTTYDSYDDDLDQDGQRKRFKEEFPPMLQE